MITFCHRLLMRKVVRYHFMNLLVPNNKIESTYEGKMDSPSRLLYKTLIPFLCLKQCEKVTKIGT